MNQRNNLDIYGLNLRQLILSLVRNSDDVHKDPNLLYPPINSALLLVKKFDGQLSLTTNNNTIRSTDTSLEVAIIAVEEMFLDLSAAIAVILLPTFLEGFIHREDVLKFFDEKVLAILEKAYSLQGCKIKDDTIQSYPLHPDIHCPHIVALLLQLADFMRIFCNGSIVDEQDLKSFDSSSEILFYLKYFYIPLVHRMCLYEVQTKLSDFWLKHADTLSYYYITSKLGVTKIERKRKLDIITQEIQALMSASGTDCLIKRRIKSVYSIWNKIQKLHIDIDNIHDLAGIRIILTGTKGQTIEKEKVACWKVFTIINDAYTPVYNIMRDWISVPKPSGYEALHLTLLTKEHDPFEVQIRTERMDYIAEYGSAAHWKYKAN